MAEWPLGGSDQQRGHEGSMSSKGARDAMGS